MVYSSSGDYKRKIILPQRNINGQMALFDDQSILVYDNTQLWQAIVQTGFTEQVGDSTFFLISTTDGTMLEYIRLPNKNIDLSYKSLNGDFIGRQVQALPAHVGRVAGYKEQKVGSHFIGLSCPAEGGARYRIRQLFLRVYFLVLQALHEEPTSSPTFFRDGVAFVSDVISFLRFVSA